MATLEQVEKLREKANVSYDEAREALDACGGDLLEALIYLEKQGKGKPPEGNGYYSSDHSEERKAEQARPVYDGARSGETFGNLLKRFGRFCLRVLQKGNSNLFEVVRQGEVRASIPVSVLVLLLLFAFWVVLPLLIIGLFFGLRYRFQGPDLGKQTVNSAMDNVADAADELKHSIGENHKS
jgi:hypothetical protein